MVSLIQAGVLTDAAHVAAGVAVLLPLALAAARAAQPRGDRAVMVAAGLGGIASAAVFCGVLLSPVSSVGTVGWLVAIGALDLGIFVFWLFARLRRRSRTVRMRSPRRPRVRQLLPAALALAALGLTVGAVVYSSASARRQTRQSHFTQLFMVEGLRFGQPAAHIGVVNLEGRAMSYRLVVGLRQRVLYTAPVQVAANASWSTDISIFPTPERTLVTATLFRAGDPTPYRVTNLWTPSS